MGEQELGITDRAVLPRMEREQKALDDISHCCLPFPLLESDSSTPLLPGKAFFVALPPSSEVHQAGRGCVECRGTQENRSSKMGTWHQEIQPFLHPRLFE